MCLLSDIAENFIPVVPKSSSSFIVVCIACNAQDDMH